MGWVELIECVVVCVPKAPDILDKEIANRIDCLAGFILVSRKVVCGQVLVLHLLPFFQKVTHKKQVVSKAKFFIE